MYKLFLNSLKPGRITPGSIIPSSNSKPILNLLDNYSLTILKFNGTNN
jgi:hypothetical protein